MDTKNTEQTNTASLSLHDIELTKEMKYIKWPTPKKVFRQAVAVILGSIAVMVLIAAGDEIGMALINYIIG